MKKEINVRMVNEGGNNIVYPVCKEAITFAQMAREESLTPRSLCCITSLGYNINIAGYSREDIEKMAAESWQYLNAF